MESLHESVLKSDPEKTRQVAQTVLDDGISPMAAISSLTAVMVEVGDKFSRLEIFLPEMMQAGENMSAAVEVLSKEIEDFESIAKKGKIVLGTVKGDLHEIGKNIVKLMLETNGFEVKDLGYDVDSADFIKEAEAMGADAGRSRTRIRLFAYTAEMPPALSPCQTQSGACGPPTRELSGP
ncbi:MAG: B12-binding domain-containing protein [Deltaproteobacteria bacterium]|nr:B12-binding domain-containing protein [Deltaproteobacteria bacterium]